MSLGDTRKFGHITDRLSKENILMIRGDKFLVVCAKIKEAYVYFVRHSVSILHYTYEIELHVGTVKKSKLVINMVYDRDDLEGVIEDIVVNLLIKALQV